MDAEGLRRRAADLMEQAEKESDPGIRKALTELAKAFLLLARRFDADRKLN